MEDRDSPHQKKAKVVKLMGKCCVSYSWKVRCDASPHGTSCPHGERSNCVENDFMITRRSDTLFELCGLEKCMKNGRNATKSALTMQENTSKRNEKN